MLVENNGIHSNLSGLRSEFMLQTCNKCKRLLLAIMTTVFPQHQQSCSFHVQKCSYIAELPLKVMWSFAEMSSLVVNCYSCQQDNEQHTSSFMYIYVLKSFPSCSANRTEATGAIVRSTVLYCGTIMEVSPPTNSLALFFFLTVITL